MLKNWMGIFSGIIETKKKQKMKKIIKYQNEEKDTVSKKSVKMLAVKK